MEEGTTMPARRQYLERMAEYEQSQIMQVVLAVLFVISASLLASVLSWRWLAWAIIAAIGLYSGGKAARDWRLARHDIKAGRVRQVRLVMRQTIGHGGPFGQRIARTEEGKVYPVGSREVQERIRRGREGVFTLGPESGLIVDVRYGEG